MSSFFLLVTKNFVQMSIDFNTHDIIITLSCQSWHFGIIRFDPKRNGGTILFKITIFIPQYMHPALVLVHYILHSTLFQVQYVIVDQIRC